MKRKISSHLWTNLKDSTYALWMSLVADKAIFFFVVIILLVLAMYFFYPRPIYYNKITIATADKTSSYYTSAEKAKGFFESYGVTLNILETAGSTQNIKLLNDLSSNVDAAYIQGGSTKYLKSNNFYSLGSVSYEPVWIFYKKNLKSKITSLKDLKTLKVGVGPRDGGTQALAYQLFAKYDIDIYRHPSNFIFDTYQNNYKDFKNGGLDAIIEVTSVNDDFIKELILNPKFTLMEFNQADAFTKIFPFIEKVTLPIGSLDISKVIPKKNIDLIAVTTTLAVRKDLNDDFQLLLLNAAKNQIRTSQELFFSSLNQFPAYVDPTINESPIAIDFYNNPPSWFFRNFSFWPAARLESYWKISSALLLLLTLITALYKFRPFHFHGRINELYKEIYCIENKIRTNMLSEKRAAELSLELNQVYVKASSEPPASGFESEYYHLLQAIELLKRNISENTNITPYQNEK